MLDAAAVSRGWLLHPVRMLLTVHGFERSIKEQRFADGVLLDNFHLAANFCYIVNRNAMGIRSQEGCHHMLGE